MPYGCDEADNYSNPDCETDEFKYNRVVALGILKEASEGINFQLAAEWDKFVDGDPDADPVVPNTYAPLTDYLTIIGQISGTYDGGEAELVPGFGTRLEMVDAMVHTLDLTMEYQPKNDAFFDTVFKSKNYGIVFLTGNKDCFYVVQQRDITIIPKLSVTDELQKFRRVELQVKFNKIGFARNIAVSDAVKALF